MTATNPQPLTPDPNNPELIEMANGLPEGAREGVAVAVAARTKSRRQKAKQSASDLSDSATTTPDTTTAEPTTDFVTTFDVNFDQSKGFTFDQDYKLKSAFKLPEPPASVPESGEFWAVVENGTGKLYGPYMTENAALSLIQEDGVDGAISRMHLQ